MSARDEWHASKYSVASVSAKMRDASREVHAFTAHEILCARAKPDNRDERFDHWGAGNGIAFSSAHAFRAFVVHRLQHGDTGCRARHSASIERRSTRVDAQPNQLVRIRSVGAEHPRAVRRYLVPKPTICSSRCTRRARGRTPGGDQRPVAEKARAIRVPSRARSTSVPARARPFHNSTMRSIARAEAAPYHAGAHTGALG